MDVEYSLMDGYSPEDLLREQEFVSRACDGYEVDSPTERYFRRAAARVLLPYVRPGAAVLEVGGLDGYLASLLAPRGGRYVVVDACRTFIDLARTRVPPNVEFVESLIETYQPDQPFDLIIMTYILEHLMQPVQVLGMVREWLTRETGMLFVVVPNQYALSRQLAQVMGLIDRLDELTANDHNHGHRRCYDRTTLDRDLARAGYETVHQGGLILKPFANFQMDALLSQGIIGSEQMDGLALLGLRYPELSGSLFSVAKPRTTDIPL